MDGDVNSGTSYPGDMWGCEFATPHAFSNIEMECSPESSCNYDPSLTIQVLVNGQWLTVHHTQGEEILRPKYILDPPAIGNGIRIVDDASSHWHFTEVYITPVEISLIPNVLYNDYVLYSWSLKEALYQVAAVDFAGNISLLSASTGFDLENPIISIDSPIAGETLSAQTEIRGSVMDSFLAQWTVDVSLDGGSWDPVASGVEEVPDGLLAKWDAPVGFEGAATFKVTAQDETANQSFVEISVSVDGSAPAVPLDFAAFISGESINFSWASNIEPDIAGYRIYKNGNSISGDITPLANITSIVGAHEIPEAHDADPSTSSQLYSSSGFCGVEAVFNYSPSIASIDLYFLKENIPNTITLEKWNGSAWTTVTELTENVSRNASLVLPAPLSGNRFRLRFPGGAVYLGDITINASGDDFIAATALDLNGFAQYEDEYNLAAVDVNGNESLFSETIILDDVAPEVLITDPSSGDLFNASNGYFYGNVSDPYLELWSFSWAPVSADPQWSELNSGTSQVSGSIGNFFQPNQEGQGLFRLQAVDGFGNVSEDIVQVEYDWQDPLVTFNLASRYWLPTQPQPIDGSVEDIHFFSADISAKVFGASDYTPLASLSQPASGLPG